jgi:hypothetical protein
MQGSLSVEPIGSRTMLFYHGESRKARGTSGGMRQVLLRDREPVASEVAPACYPGRLSLPYPLA